MQTFLPEYDFVRCAEVLDNYRLNKQLLEGRQILEILLEPNPDSTAWKNHPAVLMWKNYEKYLFTYLLEIAKECLKRPIKITVNWTVICILYDTYLKDKHTEIPFWVTDKNHFDKIVLSHRVNLYLKDPKHYKQYEYCLNQIIYVCCQHCKYYWVAHLPNFKQLRSMGI